MKAVGKKEAGILACSAKEATKGTSIEPACNMKVEGKFTTAYDKPTGCMPAAPTSTQCETIADDCRDKLRAALLDGNETTPSKCEAARLKAAGKKASAKLGCYAKAVAKGLAVDSGCLDKAERWSTTSASTSRSRPTCPTAWAR